MAVEIPSLLIVHQNLNMAKTLATLLAKEYNVYIAKLASHVTDLVESNRIQLVLASQQLPDSTGLALFSRLRLSHPSVVRILLISDGDKDGVNVEDALAGEIIHRYLTEPLRSSHFLSSIRKGVQLFADRVDAVRPPAAEIEAPGTPEVAQPVEQPTSYSNEEPIATEVTSDLEPVEAYASAVSVPNEADALEAVGLNYEAMLQQQRELQGALERAEEKQLRIDQLEAVQKQLTEDKEQLLDKMMQFQRENAALVVLRQENASMREEVDRLKVESAREVERLKVEAAQDADRLRAEAARDIDLLKTEATHQAERLQKETADEIELLSEELARLTADNDRLKQESEALKTEAQTAQSESEKLREELNSLGMLKGLGKVAPVTSEQLQQSMDPLEVYGKAAEWYIQISQLQKLNKLLEIKVYKSEVEISRLHESMAGLRSQLEQDRAGLLRQSRLVEEQYRTLKQESEAREASLDRLQKERDELARKVLWMQAQWKAKLDQGGEG